MAAQTYSVARTLAVVLLSGVLAFPQAIWACAPAPRPGQFVRIADESAIIVWDEASRTQHFIRRATFETEAPDFGFLVPTPTRPELSEISGSDNKFYRLEALMRPKVIERSEFAGFDFTPAFAWFFYLRSAREGVTAKAPGGVWVVKMERVAGYDAVVLEADNAAELNRWLGRHGYVSSPALADWFVPYVAAHWKITAFKIAKDADYRRVASSAVRMSFTTDRPFFPYREPASQREAKEAGTEPRLLRVFFLSGSRVEGKLGEQASGKWPGQVVWADRISEDVRESLSDLVPVKTEWPKDTWLTVFEDKSSPRPGTDEVFFAPSGSQQSVLPPPEIRIRESRFPVPADLILILTGGIILLARWRRRRKRRLQSAA
ncbi:MAG TPA: DUF2330 domain-containing protein [Blastocatellia bacterium]|nr:DUF2330 domain-containing protein [Blastocatellia bacterium]